jgi:lipopolysaccharide export system protein LptA
MMARAAILMALAAALAAPAVAQPKNAAVQSGGGSTPNAMQGFSKNKGQPVHIEAERLEVRDKDKVATFFGKVQVNQGDTTMRCKTLTVFYDAGGADAKNGAAKPVAKIGPSAEQKIKKLEARGEVVVTQNDQVATGDSALFDMDTNVVTMLGNVVLTQGQNVLRGSKLVVDMTTGFSRVESGSGKDGRVQGLFLPSGNQRPGLPGKPKDNASSQPAR